MIGQDSFMARFGARLVDNGYPVIPIMPGSKIPGAWRGGAWRPYAGWSRHGERATTAAEIEIWSRWPECGIGIAAGAVVGIDIDVADPALALAIQDRAVSILGATLCIRIGRPPKRLLVFRAESTFPGRKRHPLEVLALGQQFVAYAIHPGTGQPYAWPEEGIADVPLGDLPAVTEAGCTAFLDAAWALLPDEMRTATLRTHPADGDPPIGPSNPEGTRDAIEAALAWIPNQDLPGDEWISIGAAIKSALGEPGRDLWLAWSRQSGKSGQSGRPDTPERRWATLQPRSIGAASLYRLALDRGWKPPPELILNGRTAAQAQQPHPAAALIARLAARSVAQPEAPYHVPTTLLEVDGALRLFVDYATATAVSQQPFLALGAGLCLIGAIAGRRYRTPTDLYSNVYALGIADSGGGKDHARRCVKRALYAAGLERYLGGEDLASSAGLLSSLQVHPARLFQLDEFGQFLRLVRNPRAPSHKAAIWTELTKLYTSAAEPYIGAEYADQKERPRKTIQQPCACVWGVTVPGPFWQALEAGALADGSIARFLVFLTDDDYPQAQDAPAPMQPPEELVAALQAITRGVPGHDFGGNLAEAMEASAPIDAYIVPVTPDAQEAMARVRNAATGHLRAHRGTFATALFGRQAENTAKLAMLASISRDPARPVTELRDVTWAAALVEHCIATVMREADRRVADNDTEAKHKRVLEIIRAAGEISRSDLLRKTQFLARREREEILDALVEGTFITRHISATATRPATVFAIAPRQPADAEECTSE